MSQADIQVYTDLILNRQSLIDGLMSSKDDVSQFAQQIGDTAIPLNFSADLSVAQTAIDQFRQAQSATPIVIPVQLDTSGVGGVSGGMGLMDGSASPNWSGLMAQQSQDIVDGLTPNASPNWSVLLNQPGGAGGGGGRGGGFGGMFLYYHAAMEAARLINQHNVAEERIDQLSGDALYGGTGEKHQEAMANDLLGAREQMTSLPVAGFVGKELGNNLEGLGDIIHGKFRNGFRTIADTYTGDETDSIHETLRQARSQNALSDHEEKANRHYEQIQHKDIAAERSERLKANLDGLTGRGLESAEAGNSLAAAYQQADDIVKNPSKDYPTKELAEARAKEIRDNAIREFSYRNAEIGRDESNVVLRAGDEYGHTPARNDAERVAEFHRKEDIRERDLADSDPEQWKIFHDNRSRREADEHDRLNRATSLEGSESGDRITSLGNSATEATMRAKGQLYDADTYAFNSAQDAQLSKLRERYAAEIDEAKKANLAKEISAAESAQKIERSSRIAEHDRQDNETAQLENANADAFQLRASGDDFAARQRIRTAQFQHAMGDAISHKDYATGAALAHRYDEETAEDKENENRHYQHLKIGAEEDMLRATGRGKEAEVLGLRERIAGMYRDAGNDPDKQAAVRAIGIGEVQAERASLLHQDSKFGLSGEGLHGYFQQQISEGEGLSAALKKLNQLGTEINRSDSSGGAGINAEDPAFGDFRNGAMALQAAAHVIANAKPIYTVRN